MAIPTYLQPHDAAESHAPIVRALRAGDAIAATRYMEQAVGDVGEKIAAGGESQQKQHRPNEHLERGHRADSATGRVDSLQDTLLRAAPCIGGYRGNR